MFLNYNLNMQKLFETIGWIGMGMILVGYFLVSFHVISVDNLIYQLLNIVGSSGIVLVSYLRKNYQPMVLNIIWILIGVISLIKITI